MRKKEEKKNKFDLEIEIEDGIDFHNFRKLKSTGFKQVELRHNEDEKIIEIVNNNIIKSMKRKLANKKNLKKNTLLLCQEIRKK